MRRRIWRHKWAALNAAIGVMNVGIGVAFGGWTSYALGAFSFGVAWLTYKANQRTDRIRAEVAFWETIIDGYELRDHEHDDEEEQRE